MKIRTDIIWREIDGEVFVIDPQKDSCFELNETAALIFKMLRKGKDISEIVKKISEVYDVDEKICYWDICDTIKKFKEKGMFYEE